MMSQPNETQRQAIPIVSVGCGEYSQDFFAKGGHLVEALTPAPPAPQLLAFARLPAGADTRRKDDVIARIGGASAATLKARSENFRGQRVWGRVATLVCMAVILPLMVFVLLAALVFSAIAAVASMIANFAQSLLNRFVGT